MGIVTYIGPDVLKVEKDWKDYWRVFNGEHFTHGFKTKAKAKDFAIQNNGSAVALCTLHNGTYIYTKLEVV